MAHHLKIEWPSEEYRRGYLAGMDQAFNEMKNQTYLRISQITAAQESPARAAEAPQKATSEPSSASTSETPAEQPSELPTVSLEWFPAPSLLTFKTGDYSKSIRYTPTEWEAIHNFCSHLNLILPLRFRFTESKAGDPGPVSPDSRFSQMSEQDFNRIIGPAPSLSKESGELTEEQLRWMDKGGRIALETIKGWAEGRLAINRKDFRLDETEAEPS